MVVIDLQEILFAEPCIVTGEPRFRGYVGENGENELDWEFENCEWGMG